jgi:hypothetical protein
MVVLLRSHVPHELNRPVVKVRRALICALRSSFLQHVYALHCVFPLVAFVGDALPQAFADHHHRAPLPIFVATQAI